MHQRQDKGERPAAGIVEKQFLADPLPEAALWPRSDPSTSMLRSQFPSGSQLKIWMAVSSSKFKVQLMGIRARVSGSLGRLILSTMSK